MTVEQFNSNFNKVNYNFMKKNHYSLEVFIGNLELSTNLALSNLENQT